MNTYKKILQKKAEGRKQFAMLIDPDKFQGGDVVRRAEDAGADMLFVGGSLITAGDFSSCVSEIRGATSLPLLIFPGNDLQISSAADAILLLSLISGRNADLLIGKHIHAAPALKKSGLEIIPTGYILVDGGTVTAAQYMSGTMPVPADKPEIAACTALAGEMLGMKLIYLDAGSGARSTVPAEMIHAVSGSLSVPLITGGGINTPEKAETACAAGADIIVIGTALEKNSAMISSLANTIHSF